ncbi:MAG TPA: hypothetical protein VKU19_23425 [Bryobacteraceae bacterium]|nr:hypothetical protein [Bryobacteraceae bacterium]
MSHPAYTLLMAVLVAGAGAVTGSRTGRERVYAAAYMFLVCIASVVAGGWFMYLVHG